MLHKLAAVGGVEVIEASTHVKGGLDYHYRVIVKIADDLFIEAYDPLNEMIFVGDRRYIWGRGGDTANGAAFTMYDLPLQELDEASWAVTTSTKGQNVVAGLAVPDMPELLSTVTSLQGVSFPFLAPSMLVKMIIDGAVWQNAPLTVSRMTSSGPQATCGRLRTQGGTIQFPFGSSDGTGVFTLNNSGPRGVLINGVAAVGTYSLLFASTLCRGLTLSQPTGHQHQDTGWVWPSNCGILGLDGVRAETSVSYLPRLMSGAILRVSSSVDVDGSLVAPSEWFEFPIHLSASAYDGEGIVFSTSNEPYSSQYIYVGVLDTTRGNGFGGGRAPVVGRFSPVVFGPLSTTAPYISAFGDTLPGNGNKLMDLHYPSLPIGSDSVTGGPVVANLFATSSDEIRGVFPPFLACSSALSLGTMGWLAGNRYKVIRSGLMMRVG
jgi:hypothetical protein